MTQVDLTVADDEELLQLLCDANFVEVQLGIESTDEAALPPDEQAAERAAGTPPGPCAGSSPTGSWPSPTFIVGTDADDAGAFARALDFLEAAQVVHHTCHPLQAPPAPSSGTSSSARDGSWTPRARSATAPT